MAVFTRGFSATAMASSERGTAPGWQQRIEALAHLPKAQQRFVAQLLDSVLSQAASR